MNATRIGIMAVVAASAIFAVTMYTMLAGGSDDPDGLPPDLDLRLRDFDLSQIDGPPHTRVEETTVATLAGGSAVTRSKLYLSGGTTRVDTLNSDGSVTRTRISHFGSAGATDCDWAARTCRETGYTRSYFEDLQPTRPRRTATPGPSATPFDLRTAIAGHPTARLTSSDRTILGEAVTCTVTETPGYQREICKTSDRVKLYARTFRDGTTTTTVATKLLRFIPYEAIGLPFPLENAEN